MTDALPKDAYLSPYGRLLYRTAPKQLCPAMQEMERRCEVRGSEAFMRYAEEKDTK